MASVATSRTLHLTGASPRHQAAAILAESRFRDRGLPRPLHGVFQTLGGWLATVGNWIVAVAGDVQSFLAANPGMAVLVAIIVVVLGTVWAISLRRRRIARQDSLGAADEDGLSPESLRLRALDAERAGDWSEAVRLYFQAAILQLQRFGSLPNDASLTVGDARRRLPSPVFAIAAQSFESVVYGLRPARVDDIAAVKDAWPGDENEDDELIPT